MASAQSSQIEPPKETTSTTLNAVGLLRLWIAQRIGPGARVLEFGAGSGRGYVRLAPENVHVTGLDIASSVLRNPYLDEARVGSIEDPPFPNHSFDLVCSDFTLEHLENPEAAAGGIRRVLKPGGWFVTRTPNRWHYVTLAAQILPERLHFGVISLLTPRRPKDEIFRTFYRCNTARALKRIFADHGFCCEQLVMWEAEPSYLLYSRLKPLGELYSKIVNSTSLLAWARCNILACFRSNLTA